jgi:hypothetical protein
VAPSWIITLHAGAAPALIPEPRGLMGPYDFFTSRTLEDGRERFRLHVGFFDDLPTAKNLLRVAREHYPAAWLVPSDQYRGLRRVLRDRPNEDAVDGAPRHTPRQWAEGPMLEAAEVFALLGGAATLLAGVLPDVPAQGAGIPVDAVASAATARPATVAAARPADTLIRDMSRFIVEEWQPEARRPQRLAGERAWFKRFRRAKRAERSQTAAS